MAGANKPDGKSNTQRVSFTRRDADRIGRVVRTVEAGDKKGNALTFGHRQQPGQGVVGDIFRTARFTGSWSVDSVATIEFTNSTFTPQTATANNLFCSIKSGDVGVAKDVDNTWYLIAWEMETATAVFVTATATTAVLQSVTVAATLNTSNCSIVLETTNNTSTLKIISSTVTATYLRLP
jgi:hypothetical protein